MLRNSLLHEAAIPRAAHGCRRAAVDQPLVGPPRRRNVLPTQSVSARQSARTRTPIGESKSFLLIGETNLARHAVAALELAGHRTTVVAAPDAAPHLCTTFDGIAVLTHDDVMRCGTP